MSDRWTRRWTKGSEAVLERQAIEPVSAAGLPSGAPLAEPFRQLLVFWEARQSGGALKREDLDPILLRDLLANIFLVDQVSTDPCDVFYRLVGTKIVEVEGEMTRTHLSELVPRSAANETLWQHYERVFAGKICLRRQTLAWQGRDHIGYEVLLLPMIRSGDEIDSALGMILYDAPYQRSGLRGAITPNDKVL